MIFLYFALVILVLGVVFVVLPSSWLSKYSSQKTQTVLNKRVLEVGDIIGMILFVSKLGNGSQLSDLLAYKMLNNISKVKQKRSNKQYIWLIYGELSKEANSSYMSACKLKAEFQSPNLNVNIVDVEDINDPSKSFSVIDDIFNFEIQKYGLKDSDIVCDVTGGTKTMSIGMALACMLGKRRMIYFAKDASKDDLIVEIDAKRLLHYID